MLGWTSTKRYEVTVKRRKKDKKDIVKLFTKNRKKAGIY